MDRGELARPPADVAFPVPFEDDLTDLYENMPCGTVSTLSDGTIIKINNTLLDWLGYPADAVVGVLRFANLLSTGSRVYYESHLAPLLLMQNEVGGVAVDLRAAGGERIPALINMRIRPARDGRTRLIRIAVFDARVRRAYERELLSARQAAERDRERLQHLVAGLQRSLLPATLPAPEHLEIAAHYHMASPDEVGGDFYDFFPLGGDRWGFFLGDVCGKGIDAAAATATARYTLRAAAVYDPDPAAVLANLNSVLFQEYYSDRHRHCTVVFGILAPEPGGYVATIAGGGHPAPLLLYGDGSVRYLDMTGGTVIGILPDARIATRTVRLDPGDTLLLYTDGLTEARADSADGRYGANALLDFAGGLAPSTAADCVDALTRLVASLPYGLEDDVAFLAITVNQR
ncbi:MAG TPA: SpoIIE family protein phosphatase [Actinoplanes sp.]|nr:SpoIIE family protein phosphatase [Actinoplanes sp.]